MKVSEMFLEAAKSLPHHKYTGMCNVVQAELRKLEQDDFLPVAQQAQEILELFKPEGDVDGYWFVPDTYASRKEFSNNYFFKNVKEVQAVREAILIWCWAIAESEGV